MVGTVILLLLCLALASLVLRVGLFFLGKDNGRLAKIASITQSIGDGADHRICVGWQSRHVGSSDTRVGLLYRAAVRDRFLCERDVKVTCVIAGLDPAIHLSLQE